MSQTSIGVAVMGANSEALLDGIQRAEERGLSAAWLTTSGAGPDALTLFAGAALRTERILMGTAITPSFPRHPVAIAQQVQVIGQLAPGRFRLGVGTSGRSGMVETFGANFRAPLGHLREYVRILKALLQTGEVDVDGRYYTAHARISAPMDVPIMASALGEKAFEMCGAEADGAISWVCPREYLRDVAVPAMKSAAEGAGRPTPPLIAHAPVCVHDNPEEVRAAVRSQFGGFPRTPFYQRMFVAAGFSEAAQGTWSDAMIDAVAIYGSESQVTQRLQEMSSFGAAEVLVSTVAVGDDPAASTDRTMDLLSKLADTN